jgi:hypothetical protein
VSTDTSILKLSRLKPKTGPLALLLALAVALAALASHPGAARASAYDMRGEWKYSLTCSCGPVAEEGVMIVRQMNLVSGEYSGTNSLSGFSEGTASGIVSGTSLSLEMPLPLTPLGPSSYTMTNGTLEVAQEAFSGSGYYGASPGGLTGEIKASKTRSLEAVEKEEQEAAERAQEAKEKAEKEAKEREASEAAEKALKEKAEAEHKEKVEAEQRELQAREQQEAKARQQAKEQAEREAKEKAAREASVPQQPTGGSGGPQQLPTEPLAAAHPLARTVSVGRSGIVSFELSNPNAYGVNGEVALEPSGATGRQRGTRLAKSQFSISATATRTVKLKLSKLVVAEIARHRSIHLQIKVTTRATGHSASVTSYVLIVRGAAHTHH